MRPPVGQTVTLFIPIVYLVSGFRWSFYEIADVHVGVSLPLPPPSLACAWRRSGGSSGPAIVSRHEQISARAARRAHSATRPRAGIPGEDGPHRLSIPARRRRRHHGARDL